MINISNLVPVTAHSVWLCLSVSLVSVWLISLAYRVIRRYKETR